MMHQHLFSNQINEDGFGDLHTTGGLERHTMAVFQGKLYVGAANRNGGAVVMSYDEKKWVKVAKNGFGSPANTAITCLFATDTKLYAGTSNEAGGEVWEYDGANWRCLHKGPFGAFPSNLVQGVVYYKGRVYVGLWNQGETRPVQVWAGDTQGTWELVNKPGFGDVENEAIPSMKISSVDGTEKLYVAIWKDFEYRGKDSGAEIWSFDGKLWEKRNAGREGFGELNKGRPGMEPLTLFEFNKKLYVGLWSFGAGAKGELWSFDGKDWTQARSSFPPRALQASMPWRHATISCMLCVQMSMESTSCGNMTSAPGRKLSARVAQRRKTSATRITPIFPPWQAIRANCILASPIIKRASKCFKAHFLKFLLPLTSERSIG